MKNVLFVVAVLALGVVGCNSDSDTVTNPVSDAGVVDTGTSDSSDAASDVVVSDAGSDVAVVDAAAE